MKPKEITNEDVMRLLSVGIKIVPCEPLTLTEDEQNELSDIWDESHRPPPKGGPRYDNLS